MSIAFCANGYDVPMTFGNRREKVDQVGVKGVGCCD